MAAAAKAKKTEQIILRLDPGVDQDFRDAVKDSDMGITEALRLAISAMIAARKKLGRIPRDMEVRQAIIGDVIDIEDLLQRVEAIAESRSDYIVRPRAASSPSSVDQAAQQEDERRSTPAGGGSAKAPSSGRKRR